MHNRMRRQSALARKLEQFQRGEGDRRAFVAMLKDVVAKRRGSPDLWSFISELLQHFRYGKATTVEFLLKLFDLHCGYQG